MADRPEEATTPMRCALCGKQTDTVYEVTGYTGTHDECEQCFNGTTPHAPCRCVRYCGDDGDTEGPGTCKQLPHRPRPPLVEIVLVHRNDLP